MRSVQPFKIMSLKYIVLKHIMIESLPNKTTELKSDFFASKYACECAFNLQEGKLLSNCIENRRDQNEWANEKNEGERETEKNSFMWLQIWRKKLESIK